MIVVIAERQLYLSLRLLCGLGRPLLIDILGLNFLWDSLAPK